MKITTRKLQPTDTRGERVRASGYGQSCTVPWDYGLSAEAMHEYAARRLAQRVAESYSAPDVHRVGSTTTGYVYEVAR